jgi:hypothetical protein
VTASVVAAGNTIPNFPKNSVILFFNALYHNVQISLISNAVEENPHEWFSDRDIP